MSIKVQAKSLFHFTANLKRSPAQFILLVEDKKQGDWGGAVDEFEE